MLTLGLQKLHSKHAFFEILAGLGQVACSFCNPAAFLYEISILDCSFCNSAHHPVRTHQTI